MWMLLRNAALRRLLIDEAISLDLGLQLGRALTRTSWLRSWRAPAPACAWSTRRVAVASGDGAEDHGRAPEVHTALERRPPRPAAVQ
jgi:hypothetical protein